MNKQHSMTRFLSLCVFSVSILDRVECGIPITYPSCDGYDNCQYFNGPQITGKNVPYNLIDVDPICWYKGWCPMFPPGGELSAFPNSEEKWQHFLHQQHRLFPNQSLGTNIGMWAWGGSKGGGETTYDTSKYCGDWDDDINSVSELKPPQHWYSDANQAARFKQYDENTCDQDWYDEEGEGAHSTCFWGEEGLVENTSPIHPNQEIPSNRCQIFGDREASWCGYTARSATFADEDGAWAEMEGICASNSCVTDPHCTPIFGSAYIFVGKGFVEGMNGAASQYIRSTPRIYYPLYIGTFTDERPRLPGDYWDEDGKYATFFLGYYDVNQTQTPDKCWILYDDTATEMDVYLSNAYNDKAARDQYLAGEYTHDSYSVMFTARFAPKEMTCRPYAFYCHTSLGNTFRLPEEDSYYFGTEYLDWSWLDWEATYNMKCKENHYYCNLPGANCQADEWLVNGGPTLTSEDDIWYYQSDEFGECIGCDYIPQLQCIEGCFNLNGNLENCACPGFDGTPVADVTDEPTPKPTEPTPQPTSPTPQPTIPTPQPTIPTPDPTRQTSAPSPSPTVSGETCSSVIDYEKFWLGVREEPEDLTDELSQAEEDFLDEYPECGEWNTGEMEYYYRTVFTYKNRVKNRRLDLYMHVCCGQGATFGDYYDISQATTDGQNYTGFVANAAIVARIEDKLILEHGDDHSEWTQPSQFGIKQYLVFGIMIAIFMCCCCSIMYAFYWYKYKKGKAKFKKAPSSMNEPSSTHAIQMQGMSALPGPSHVSLPSSTIIADGTDGSTDGSNRYTGRFIHHHFDDVNTPSISNLGKAPPMKFMGVPNKFGVKSVSIDSPDMSGLNEQSAEQAPALFSGLPPPKFEVADQSDYEDDAQDLSVR